MRKKLSYLFLSLIAIALMLAHSNAFAGDADASTLPYHATLFYGSDEGDKINIKYGTHQPDFSLAYIIYEFVDGKYVAVGKHDPKDADENETWKETAAKGDDVNALIREDARWSAYVNGVDGVDTTKPLSLKTH